MSHGRSPSCQAFHVIPFHDPSPDRHLPRQRGELDEFEEEIDETDEGIVDIEDDLDVFAKGEDFDASEFDAEDEAEKVEGLDEFEDEDLDDDLDLEDEDDL